MTATPYLCVHDGAAALDFYASAFGAIEHSRWVDENGRMGHSEFELAGTTFFLSDEYPEMCVLSAKTLGGCPLAFVVMVEDADAAFAAATAAGATIDRPLVDEFDGRRAGWLKDPFGFRWNISTSGPELTNDELQERVGDEFTITHKDA